MNNKRFNAIINITILLFFMIATISGIIIWLVLPGSSLGFQPVNSSQDIDKTSSTIFLELPRSNWIDIHIISSLIFVILVVLHDVLHWKWFKSLPKILRS